MIIKTTIRRYLMAIYNNNISLCVYNGILIQKGYHHNFKSKKH